MLKKKSQNFYLPVCKSALNSIPMTTYPACILPEGLSGKHLWLVVLNCNHGYNKVITKQNAPVSQLLAMLICEKSVAHTKWWGI